MKTEKLNLSPVRINRIRAQGYEHQTDQEIANLAFGNRFAYRLCVSIFSRGGFTLQHSDSFRNDDYCIF